MFGINYSTTIDFILRDIRKFVPQFAGMNAGDQLLDVCCGTGAQVLECGRLGIKATGIDIDPSMLQIALKNRAKSGLTTMAFLLGNATSLPFPDNHFNYASVSFGLHDKEQTVRNDVISEMQRVVIRDGILVLADFQVPLPRNVWAQLVRIIEFIAGGSHYRNFSDYVKSGGLEEILRRHHLQELDRTYLKSGILLVVKVANKQKRCTTTVNSP